MFSHMLYFFIFYHPMVLFNVNRPNFGPKKRKKLNFWACPKLNCSFYPQAFKTTKIFLLNQNFYILTTIYKKKSKIDREQKKFLLSHKLAEKHGFLSKNGPKNCPIWNFLLFIKRPLEGIQTLKFSAKSVKKWLLQSHFPVLAIFGPKNRFFANISNLGGPISKIFGVWNLLDSTHLWSKFGPETQNSRWTLCWSEPITLC